MLYTEANAKEEVRLVVRKYSTHLSQHHKKHKRLYRFGLERLPLVVVVRHDAYLNFLEVVRRSGRWLPDGNCEEYKRFLGVKY